MADNYLITGYWGEPHVTAENDRGINAAMFGAGRFVLPVGEQFRAEYIGNNTIRMYDGKLMDNGAAAGIPVGEYVDLLIANAGQGKKRNDMIVFQYSQDHSTLVESGIFTVIQGSETDGTASDPTLTQEDLLSGEAAFDQMALWRVSVSGATISAPEKLFSVYPGSAPAGFGLGKSGIWINDLNLADKCGYYSWTSTAQNIPFAYGNMFVIRRGDGRITQIGIDPYMEGHSGIVIRHYSGSKWLVWEWVNPLMNPGVEYRTTERWKGKAVYTKMVDIGALPNSTTKTIDIGVTSSKIIRSFVNITSSSGINVTSPYFLTDGTMVVKHLFTAKNIQLSTTADYTDRTATVQVWYIE